MLVKVYVRATVDGRWELATADLYTFQVWVPIDEYREFLRTLEPATLPQRGDR